MVTTIEQSTQRNKPALMLHDLLHRRPELGPLAVLVIAVVVFGLLNQRFLYPSNISLIAQQAAVVGAIAVGQTVIIITAGIDLSCGAVMLLSAFAMASLTHAGTVSAPVALVLGLIVAIALQTVNGLLVTRIHLPAFIVTLGTLGAYTALSVVLAGGTTIQFNSPDANLLTWSGTVVSIFGFRITTGVLIMLALYAIVGYALTQTPWGRHLYAAGGDPDAASLTGIPVRRVVLSAYVIAGVACFVAAWILTGRTLGSDPSSAPNINLASITAVVIGGTSLFGGRGSLFGTLLGALIVVSLDNGLTLAGVQAAYTSLAQGVLVIVAVCVDQWIRKVKR